MGWPVLDWPAAAPEAASAPGRRPGRVRAWWLAGLAVVLVALAGWLLSSALGGPAPPRPAATPASAPATTPGPATVNVNAAAPPGHHHHQGHGHQGGKGGGQGHGGG